MIESPHQTIASILCEPTNGFDDLRIIAKDRGGRDRAIIESVADELETAQRTLVKVYAELVETRQKLLATNEALLAAREALLALNKPSTIPGLSMTIEGILG